MILFYDKDINDYINTEMLKSLQNNKWIRYLLLLPKEFFSIEDDSMHIILFIIYNEDEFDMETKINIVRYLSGKHYGWNDHNDGYVQDFFKQINHSKKIYPMKIRNKTWNYISAQCRKHADIDFSILYNEYKRRDEAKRVQFYKEQKKKQDFLQSPLYRFIRKLTYKEGQIITSKNLYQMYCKFCKTNKLQTVSQNSFGKSLSTHKIISFRYKQNRSYRLEQEYIDNFINFYGTGAYEAEVERKRQKAETIAMLQEDKAERKRQEAEMERIRQEAEMERIRQEAEMERIRQEAEMERIRQELKYMEQEDERTKQNIESERRKRESKRVQIYKEQKKKQDFLQSALYQFIQRLGYKEGDIITSKDLYQHYCNFCKDSNLQFVSQISFGKTLSTHKMVSFRYKQNRSYRMEQDTIDNFINFYKTND